MADTQLIILNGLARFPQSDTCTHHSTTASGHITSSLLDYAICDRHTLDMITHLIIHGLTPHSDHKYVEVRIRDTLPLPTSVGQNKKNTEPSKYFVLGKDGLERFKQDMSDFLEQFHKSKPYQSLTDALRLLHITLQRKI